MSLKEEVQAEAAALLGFPRAEVPLHRLVADCGGVPDGEAESLLRCFLARLCSGLGGGGVAVLAAERVQVRRRRNSRLLGLLRLPVLEVRLNRDAVKHVAAPEVLGSEPEAGYRLVAVRNVPDGEALAMKQGGEIAVMHARNVHVLLTLPPVRGRYALLLRAAEEVIVVSEMPFAVRVGGGVEIPAVIPACGQLSLYLVMYSPLQMAADLPEHYEKYDDAFQFIRDVACDWDDSKYLEAEPAKYITVARKAKGTNNWFVGGKTDAARTSVVKLDFLDKGKKYDCAIYQDGKNADYEKNPKSYQIIHKTVKKGDVLKIKEARGGGFAISLLAK